ncbi:uncharacterized protein BP01DRAFT_353512 [Aspergillus saccharolyticus JOP 1030-1]|uniref:Uncharacterized protein n=1 Tax=Aspergillus saccharolyticus JOP 1030-1 TaxID=1450539 RepID=A0A318ZL98_9EURO|nr:hypothetical protein BP01DRAFT_353512 [Aspergillus saccharolyticus JOP 1030-1]PYH48369.1 hypothetical protein BP01DRAFT_353512 [Aspergillus saccharolyticus JOP 1030-1]
MNWMRRPWGLGIPRLCGLGGCFPRWGKPVTIGISGLKDLPPRWVKTQTQIPHPRFGSRSCHLSGTHGWSLKTWGKSRCKARIFR